MQESEPIVATLLVHNGRETVERAVHAVLDQTLPPRALVVVNNGSDDDSLQIIERALAARNATSIVDIVDLTENTGVGAGHNAGWRRALSEHDAHRIWVLEHDSIALPDCLERLVEAAASSAEPTIVFPRIEPNERALDRPVRPPPRRFTLNGPLIPRAVVERVGFLREDYFVGQEDWDYSERVSANNVQLRRVDAAAMVHRTRSDRRLGIRASPDRLYYSTRNLVFRRRHAADRTSYEMSARGVRALGASLRDLVQHRSPRHAAARVQGWFHGATGRLGPRRARRRTRG
jgi:GT2 family glycosyltransferase